MHITHASKLTVIVFPLFTEGYLFSGVPVLHEFPLGNSKEVVEGGMDAVKVTLANTKHKISLG